MTMIEAKFIMFFLSDPLLRSCVKNPRLKRAGIVLNPKINITSAPKRGLPVLAAVTAKK